MGENDTSSSLPVMIYNYLDDSLKDIADNIWNAQMAGWPNILTYIYRPKADKGVLRRKTLGLVPRIQSRDEYPFASTLENEGSVWVGHASVAQQNAQGSLISKFYQENFTKRMEHTKRARHSGSR
jgi:hypothetical protein